mmetsp:Transcript_108840/g.234402  ORF Transcript_108840/g.234402 Transcript_108840/m.234402 type:complete len:472 (-) Transcript_108840:240-1655(-)
MLEVLAGLWQVWTYTTLAPDFVVSSNMPIIRSPPCLLGLDFLSPACGACFRSADSPVHVSLLAFELARPVAALHASEYSVQYVTSSEVVAEAMWTAGHVSILWPAQLLHRLPYVDFAVDVVVVNNTASSLAGVPGGLAAFLNEAVRILMPTGTLALTEAAPALPGFALSMLVLPSHFANILRRPDADPVEAAGVPVCPQCGTDFPNIGDLGSVRHPFAEVCRPRLANPEPYQSLHSPQRKAGILREKSLVLGRLRTFPVGNVFSTKPDGFTSVLQQRYTGAVATQNEWNKGAALRKLLLSRRVNSILDSGAGTCSLAGVLEQQGRYRRLRQYVAFGAYNCGMLRSCAERGFISFQHNWINKLPFCDRCKFDVVLQLEGLHHVDTIAGSLRTFDNFDAVLACEGVLHLDDGIATRSENGTRWTWVDIFHEWFDVKRAEKKYKEIIPWRGLSNQNGGGPIQVQKLCPPPPRAM